MKDLSKDFEKIVQIYASTKSISTYQAFDLALKTQHNRMMWDTFQELTNSMNKIENLLIDKNEEQLNKKYLPIEAAALFLNLTKSTLYSKVHKNEITYCKRSGRLYFLRKDLINFIEDGRNTTKTDQKSKPVKNKLKTKSPCSEQ